MSPRILFVGALLAAGAVLGTGAPVGAQVVYPLQNPSARSAGMGGASAAAVWSGDLNAWANPALLGYASGMTFRWSRARLSYLSPPPRIGAGGIAYGWGGLGFTYERDWLRAGFSGPIVERLVRWGGAISVSRVLETVRGDASLPGIARHADLALGFTRKRGELKLFPSGAIAASNATDFGLVARATPLPKESARWLCLDLTYGFAVLKEPIDQIGSSTGNTPRHRRHGIGVRAGLPTGAGSGGRLVGWFTQGADPILALTIAADFDRFDDVFAGGPFGSPQPRTSREVGAELEFANTLAVRVGHVRDEVQDLDSFCFGLGIAPPIASFARVRYDYARFPSTGFDPDKMGNRHTISAWVDPIAMVRR